MKLAATLCGGLLGVAVCAFAQSAPADAPLSQSKQQLQSLRKDQAAQKTGATDQSLRNAVPTLTVPSANPVPPAAMPRSAQDEAAKKAKQSSNWLLDGFDRLERRRAGEPKSAAEKRAEAEEEAPLDPADPDYFLKVYERQRNDRLAAQGGEQGTSGAGSPPALNNAFAPFLNDWLAGSPVSGALKEILADGAPGTAGERAGADPGAGAAGNAIAESNRPAAGSVGAMAERRRESAPNPFVQALGLNAAGTEAPSLETRSLAPLLPQAPGPRPSELTTPELPKIESVRKAPPSPADEKKYFPQLKKF